MKIGLLGGIVVYYLIISLGYFAMSQQFPNFSAQTNISFNQTTGLNEDDIDKGGLFGSGVSFTRYIGFVTLGFGLPDDVPNYVRIGMTSWAILIDIFVIGFIISSIWDG